MRFFQYYTALYQVEETGIHNEILQNLEAYIEKGKESRQVNEHVNPEQAAECIWLMLTGISGMLASHVNYKYQEGYKALMYGDADVNMHNKFCGICKKWQYVFLLYRNYVNISLSDKYVR